MGYMSAARYFQTRAEHYKRLASETPNEMLKGAYRAIAVEMLRKAAVTEPDDKVYLVGDLAVDLTISAPSDHRRACN